MVLVLIFASITMIWLCWLIKKLMFSEEEKPKFRENLCHCKLWHSCPVEFGWRIDPFERAAQRDEISRAFRKIESSAYILTQTYFKEVSAENIILHAFRQMTNKGSCISLIEECLPLLDLLQWTLEKYDLQSDLEKDDKRVILNVKEVKRKILSELKLHGIKSEIAIDTERVGAGYRGSIDMLARVSLVNKQFCIYDKYVKPTQPVTDYRTFVSGIKEENIIDAEDFETVQQEVADLVQNRILVGHDLSKDLKVLKATYPSEYVWDIAMYKPFRWVSNEKPSLKSLASHHLRRNIQRGQHSSVEDARAAMDLYLTIPPYHRR